MFILSLVLHDIGCQRYVVTNQAEIDKWNEDDNMATYYLFNTCTEQQQRTLLTCETANSI